MVNECGTATIALLSVPDSPAVDKADSAKAPEFDQRGVKRDVDPDIGAYELKIQPNTEDIPENDITVTAYNGVYDKLSHSIEVADSGGGTITYCDEPDGIYGTENPTYTNAGSYTIYFKIKRATGDFNEYCGMSSVDITPIKLAAEQIKAADKIFDGNVFTTVDIVYTGVLSGDTVTAAATGTFADANVETSKVVVVSNVVAEGNTDGNYILPSNYDDTTASITQATGLTAASTGFIPIKELTAKEYGFDLDSIALSASNYGTKSYQVGYVNDSDGVLNGNPYIEDNHMLRFLTEPTCTTGSEIAIQINVETQNYETAQVTLTAKVLSKEPVTLEGLMIENKEYDGQAVYSNGILSVTNSEGTDITSFVTPWYNYLSADGGGYSSQEPPLSAGAYKLTVLIDNEDYTGFMDIPFSITPKEITVQAENAKAFVGGAMPGFTYIVTGLVSGDTLITEPTYDFTALSTITAGVFDIIPKAADAGGNYTIRYEKAALIIVQLYSFKAAAGTGGSVNITAGNYEAGDVINITATPNSSYRFTNWTTSGLGSFENSESDNTTFTMLAANVAIKANLTYDGSSSSSNNDSNNNNGPSRSSASPAAAKDITISVEETPLGQILAPKEIEVSFNDIAGHWAKENILFVAEKGLFSGTGNNQFNPDMAMTRGMFVTLLGRHANEDISSYTASRFSDVDLKTYYMPFIEWAAQKGIVNGIGNGFFDPEAPVIIEQMAVILANYARVMEIEFAEGKGNDKTFIDEDRISGWAKDAIHTIKNTGIISGRPDNSFDPQNTATRAEVASVLARFMKMIEK